MRARLAYDPAMSAPEAGVRVSAVLALLTIVAVPHILTAPGFAGAFAETAQAQESAQAKESASPAKAEPAAVAEQLLEPGVSPAAQPLRVFSEIERAWGCGDPESLLVHFGTGKVSLSFSRTGPRGGLYTRTQAAYLLADMFKYSKTEQFKFLKFRNIEREGQLPFAVADRIYRLDNGILYHDQVYVSLRRETDAWKVAEIKSIEH